MRYRSVSPCLIRSRIKLLTPSRISRTASLGLETNVVALGSDIRGLQVQHLQQDQQLQQAEIQRSSNQEAVLQEINNRFLGVQQPQQQVNCIHDQEGGRQDVSIRESIKTLHSSQTSLQESVTKLHTNQQRLELKLDIVTATQIVSAAERELRESTSLTPTSIDLSKRHCSKLPTQIKASFVSKTCTDSCICVCHPWRAQRTRGRLQEFIGTLFLGALAILALQCRYKRAHNIISCQIALQTSTQCW